MKKLMAKMTKKQKKLVIKNYKLMQRFIDSRNAIDLIPSHLRDDFISDMALRFCISAIKFDESFGFNFSTYVYGGFDICWEDITGRTDISYKKNNFFPQKTIKRFIEKSSHTPAKHIEEEVLHSFVDETKLTERESMIVKNYYFDGKTMAVIGEEFGVTGSRIAQVLKKVVRKLKFEARTKNFTIDDFYISQK